MVFAGFYKPRANFFRLPNDWFDIWAKFRELTSRRRILAPLKVLEYIIKWTWGYQNFDQPARITRRDFRYGKLNRGGQRQDRGAGLSSRSVEKALNFLGEVGAIVVMHMESQDGPSFLPRLRTKDDLDGFLGCTEAEENTFSGFNDPEANYFKVPSIWTDLTQEVNSEVVILSVEYFFRHTWGWGDDIRWMDIDDVANGRRYRSPDRKEERYDNGIGYSERSVREGLDEGVDRGWLVWRNKNGKRGKEYSLRLEGMDVDSNGRLRERKDISQVEQQATMEGQAPKCAGEAEETDYPTGKSDEQDTQAELKQLQAQMESLAKVAEQLLAELQELGSDVDSMLNIEMERRKAKCKPRSEVSKPRSEVSKPRSEVSKPRSEVSKPQIEQSKPQNEASKPPIIQTPYPDTNEETKKQTPPPPNTAARARIGGVGGDFASDNTATSSKQCLIERLAALDPPMSQESACKLIDEHGVDMVQAWLDVLERDPTARSVPALLVHKLRSGETPPGIGHRNTSRKPDKSCPLCHGTGWLIPNVLEVDPDYGKKLPCPRCASAKGN